MCALVHGCIYECAWKDLDVFTPWHVGTCERLLLLQSADGKRHTGAYPRSSCSLTDTRTGDSVSSLCSRGRESTNEQGPHTVLEGGRASTAARSPCLAASRSLPPPTSPAAASTGDTDSPEADTGGDRPTATAEPPHGPLYVVQPPPAAPAAAASCRSTCKQHRWYRTAGRRIVAHRCGGSPCARPPSA